MRVALVIGHTITSGGAASYNGLTEFEYNEELVGMIANNLQDSSVDPLIFYRTSYSQLPAQINTKDPDLVVSFHCNAFNKEVSGSEVLYYHKSKTGKRIAEKVLRAIRECLGLADRGIKPKTYEDRGGYLLKKTKAPCIILEPFFIDNPSDFSIGIDLRYELSLSISDAIVDLGL